MKVSNAINILNSGIDGKICKQQENEGTDTATKCESGHSSGSSKNKLSEAFGDAHATSTEKVKQHTSTTISKDTAGLTREEKGVVSSVFAKVIEGAEILEIHK